jgi:hypothetical protein
MRTPAAAGATRHYQNKKAESEVIRGLMLEHDLFPKTGSHFSGSC